MIVLKHYLSLNKALYIGTNNSESGEFMEYVCPICGYNKLQETPYDKDGNPSYEVCKCCGFEFGFDEYIEDNNGEILEFSDALKIYRSNWIKAGAILFSPNDFPKEILEDNKLTNQFIQKQLTNIGINYKDLF